MHQEIYEFWPSDLQQVFAEAGIPRRKPPHADPGCANAGAAGRRRAADHLAAARQRLCAAPRSSRTKERIAFNATTDADAHALYWFVDDAYVGRSSPGEPLFWQPAEAGQFRVRAVDDHGRSDERPLDVRLVE